MSNILLIIIIVFLVFIAWMIALLYSMRETKKYHYEHQTRNIEKVVNNSNKGDDFKNYVTQLSKYEISYDGWKN